MQPKCNRCASSGWVCENHDDVAWEAEHTYDNGKSCGGAGMPCPDCNSDIDAPRWLAGGTIIWTANDGWAN